MEMWRIVFYFFWCVVGLVARCQKITGDEFLFAIADVLLFNEQFV